MLKTLFRAITLAALLAGAPAIWPAAPAAAQTAADTPLQITWEVRNRFRLFREERDFQLHVEAARGRTILGAEQVLGTQSDGRGWARNMVGRLCIDVNGRAGESCTRDNVKENYITPTDHAVTVRLTGPVPVGATCAWTLDDGDGPQAQTFDCAEPVNFRARYGRTTVASVDVSSAEGQQRLSTDDRGARHLHCRPRRQHRLRRRQSRPPGRAIRRRLLLPLLSGERKRAVLPAEPRRLQGRPRLRGA